MLPANRRRASAAPCHRPAVLSYLTRDQTPQDGRLLLAYIRGGEEERARCPFDDPVRACCMTTVTKPGVSRCGRCRPLGYPVRRRGPRLHDRHQKRGPTLRRPAGRRGRACDPRRPLTAAALWQDAGTSLIRGSMHRSFRSRAIFAGSLAACFGQPTAPASRLHNATLVDTVAALQANGRMRHEPGHSQLALALPVPRSASRHATGPAGTGPGNRPSLIVVELLFLPDRPSDWGPK